MPAVLIPGEPVPGLDHPLVKNLFPTLNTSLPLNQGLHEEEMPVPHQAWGKRKKG